MFCIFPTLSVKPTLSEEKSIQSNTSLADKEKEMHGNWNFQVLTNFQVNYNVFACFTDSAPYSSKF